MGYRPHTRRVVVADLASALVSLADLRAHMRIGAGDTEFDMQLAAAEQAAVDAIERQTHRLLVPRQVTLSLPGLPVGREPVELPGGRVTEVTSVTVDDATVAGYAVVGDSPALLVPGADWPVVTGEGYPVVIVYTAGYSAVPPALIAAVKLMAEDMFDRPAKLAGDGMSDLAHRAADLAARYRIKPA